MKIGANFSGITKSILFLLFAFSSGEAYCSQENLNAGNLQFENITSINGLSNNTVYSITQDSEGFIWIGTREGLNKFDGYSVTSYYHIPGDNTSIPGNFITQLISTSSGTLLIGTTNGVCYYNKKTDSFTPILFENKSLGEAVRIIELSNKEILIAAVQGLYSVSTDYKLKLIHSSYFKDICEFKKGVIWAAIEDQILLMSDDGEIVKRYDSKLLSSKGFNKLTSYIQCLYKDSRGIIWLGTIRSGIGYYKPETDEFISLKLKEGVNPIEDNFVRTITEDANGLLWIGTESGLYTYDVEKQSFDFYGQSFNPALKGLNDKAIYSIFRSSDDVMWIGTYFGGVNYARPYQKEFYRIYADGGMSRLSGNALSEMIETSWGDIWIGTEDGGITIFDPKKNSYSYIRHKSSDPNSLVSNNVHALEEDKSGNIWIGTFIGGLSKYNRKTQKIEQVKLINPDPNVVQYVFSVFIDSKDRMWVGAISGLYMRENERSDFKIFSPDNFLGNFIYHVDEDKDGNIWVCSYVRGIYKLDSLLNISHFSRNTPGIFSDNITFFFNDSRNNQWFGTLEGGLIKYVPKENKFESLTTKNGLANNTVYAITEDSVGNIWFSTNRGISMLNPETNKIVNYTVHDGLVGNQFNFKSCLRDSKGTIYFGAVNGLTYFKPDELMSNRNNPVLHFTDFKIFNNSIKIGENNILQSHIDFQDKIRLKYKYKAITIEFVALNFVSPKSNEYAYFLEGFDNDWNYLDDRRNVSYTNLSPGTYKFHLKTSNSDGILSEDERVLTIKILPPFWLSVWGYILYAIIFVSILLLYRRYTIIRHKEKLNVQLAIMENQQKEELSQHRLNFFTYISHEFKTPLTLIIATLDHLLYFDDITPKFMKFGNSIRKNAMRLLFLINQLMDFRKMETDHAHIKYNKGDIIQFLKSTFEIFNPLFEKKNIDSAFKSDYESFVAYFDPDKIEKIVTNILSNSYKNIASNGKIGCHVKIQSKKLGLKLSGNEEDEKDLIIRIYDNGPGIAKEKINQIFEPFYTETTSNIPSNGIGLALVKSLVKYLNGSLSVESDEKQGVEFIITLPLYEKMPEFSEIQNGFIEKNLSFSLENTIYDEETDFESHAVMIQQSEDVTYELLIVEDNKELASFLGYHFSNYFKVTIARDGEEALQKIEHSQPDLIISDVMMPKMDGTELCKRVKENFETSHIPIILLTAKTSVESKMEGLDSGADAYISKPFSVKELGLHIRNILLSRENLKKHLMKFGVKEDTFTSLNNKDQKFIEHLTKIIYKNMDNPQFDVDNFAAEAAVSRTLLHNKLKKITNLSTTEFIKTIKLTEAKKLILKNEFSISEIAYKVGFNDPAYFSRSFKKYFKVAPSEIGDLGE